MKDKKPFQSKKFIALSVGVTFTTLFTITGLVIMAIVPEIAASVTNLITVSLATINSVIGVYALGQSIVDYKINSSHQTTQQNNFNKSIIEEIKSKEMKYDGLENIDWSKIHEEDLKNINNIL